MESYREISETAARRIDRTMLGMSDVTTLEELEIRFIGETGKILPADCLCWDNWSLDLTRLITFRLNDDYNDRFAGMLDVFGEVVSHHPVIKAGLFEATSESVMRLSDFENMANFRGNPLFREIYRHLDCHYQLAYMPITLEDRRIALTWNRRALDFNEREREILHYLGQRLGVISHRIEENRRLACDWQALSGFVSVRASDGLIDTLPPRDARLLAGLMKHRTRRAIALDLGIRSDTLDKRLGAIRERLGMENHHQLLAAIRELGNLRQSNS